MNEIDEMRRQVAEWERRKASTFTRRDRNEACAMAKKLLRAFELIRDSDVEMPVWAAAKHDPIAKAIVEKYRQGRLFDGGFAVEIVDTALALAEEEAKDAC